MIGLGTALPRYLVPQAAVCDRLMEVISDPRLKRFTRALFRKSEVRARPMVVPDAMDRFAPGLYSHGTPSLADRMAVYRREAPLLAARAARRALANAGTKASEVSHLVVVTSTAAYSPGPDVDIARELELSPSVERTLVCMMGCSGAFHGLRVARRVVDADPTARALVVCVELCSLHLDPHCDAGRIVAYTLFGDAAAAAVLRGHQSTPDHLLALGPATTRLESAHADALRWDLCERGFELSLSRSLPTAMGDGVSSFVAPLVRELTGSTDPARIDWWAVHPGGTAVLREVERRLDLGSEALTTSRDVLRALGNLSSTSVLFVLERELARVEEGALGILLGFGPGLTLEALGARRGARSAPKATELWPSSVREQR